MFHAGILMAADDFSRYGDWHVVRFYRSNVRIARLLLRYCCVTFRLDTEHHARVESRLGSRIVLRDCKN
jgi:hypothetical protein